MRFGVVPAHMDQVIFSDMVRSRIGGVRHIYVLGANHGSFPASVRASDILGDRDIRFLRDHQIHLAKDSETIAAEQQFCLYRSVCAASDSVTFTFSEFDAAGKVKLPSNLIRRISDKILDTSPRDVPFFLTHKREILDFAASRIEAEGKTPEMISFLEEEFGFLPADLTIREQEEKDLPQDVVRALYGTEISASQSRLESFVGCPFKFFMTYGLGIEETKPVDFSANYIGNFVHFGMEQLMNAIRDSGDLSLWTDAKVDDFMRDLSEEYYRERLSDLHAPRFDHLFDRISRSMRLAALSAVDELRHSRFSPSAAEYKFTRRIPLSDDFYAKINGYVDRIDTAQIDGKPYLRVIDYKTGNKWFSLEKIYNGYQMQLPLYAKMLLSEKAYEGNGIAAMEYFLAGVPKVERTENGKLTTEQLAANFKRKGLFDADRTVQKALDDTEQSMYCGVKYKKDGNLYADAPIAEKEQIDALGEFVLRKTAQISGEIAKGKTTVCPMKDGVNACAYCAYGGICRFEWGKTKTRNFQRIDRKDFFDRIGEERDS